MSRLTILILILILTVAEIQSAAAAPTAEQRRQVNRVKVGLRKAGNLYKQQRLRDAVDAVEEVQRQVDALAKDASQDMQLLLKPIYVSLERAHALLELEGFKLSPLKMPAGQPDTTETPTGAPGFGPRTGDVISFSGHMAPLLIGKCGRCHIDAERGEFSMQTYAALMRGTADAGAVIVAGDPAGSRMVEVIESGDMPRGGVKISPDELTMIKDWIAAGAKFDGGDQQASLTSLAPAAEQEPTPTIEVLRATGDETVSFSRDLAPLLAEKCNGCHGTNRPRNGFSMNTFSLLLNGGDSGPPVLPNDTAGSLIVRKLRGTGGGERMPLNQDPLPEATIVLFEKWIDEGARFDGPDPNQPMEQVAALAVANASTADELSDARAELAMQNWQLGLPGVGADRIETENFLLLGNVGPERLRQIGNIADTLVQESLAILDPALIAPWIKGRMTIYVFDQRYDYAEFGKMVESRGIPRDSCGHWRFNVVDAYGVLLLSRIDAGEPDALLVEQLTGVYLSSLGTAFTVPRWFAVGSGRAAAAEQFPDDVRVEEWDEQVPAILASMRQPADVLTGNLSGEAGSIAAYSYVKFLRKSSRYQNLLGAVRDGQAFDAAFAEVYGGPAEQGAVAWARQTR